MFHLPSLLVSFQLWQKTSPSTRNNMETRDPVASNPFTELVESLHASLSVTSSASACPRAKPTTYSGEARECSSFLLQCSLYFEMQPHQFASEEAKIAFIISLLWGRVLQWPVWESHSPITRSLDAFVTYFREVFGTSTSAVSMHNELFQLRQADMSIHDYTVEFRTLATTSGWNETTLLSAFRRELNPFTP